VSPGRYDNDGMSRFSPGRTSLHHNASQHATWALFAFPALGCALVALHAFFAFGIAQMGGTIILGDSARPGQPAYDYADAHFPKHVFGFVTGYPLVLVACCVLVLAATGLSTYRHWIPAVLLLFAAAAMPWIPAITFLFRLLSLAGQSPSTSA
jgi:hypothetical protein